MGRRSILSLSGLDWIARFVCVKTSGCRLILTGDRQTHHTLARRADLSRRQESSALSPNRGIDSIQFLALLSTPAFPDTSSNIFEGAADSDGAIVSGESRDKSDVEAGDPVQFPVCRRHARSGPGQWR